MIIPDRTKEPSLKVIEQIKIIEAEERKLSNGIPIYLINAGTQDVIKIEFLFKAGSWYEGKQLIANVTNSTLNEGTGKFTSEQIAEKIDFYGGFLSFRSDADTASVVIYCLNKHLENILSVIKEILTNASFPQKEVEIFKQKSKQKLLIENEKNKFIARKKLKELLFGEEHPYGYYAKTEDYDKITTDELKNFFKRYYTAENCKIIVAGKVHKDVINLLNKHLVTKSWHRDNGILVKSFIPISHTQKKHLIKKPKSVQSAIRIGQILFNRTHPDFIGFQIVNIILGGYFGSRLMNNIREDKGYTYGVYSGIMSLLNSGYFYIATDVGVPYCKKALNEIYSEMECLKEKLVGEKELDLVRNYILGNFMNSIDGPFALSERFKLLLLHKLKYDHYYKFIDTVKTITAKQIQDLAIKYLNRDKMFEVVVGDIK